MLKAVTFDLWETLLTDSLDRAEPRLDARIDGMLEVLWKHGLEVADGDIRRVFDGSWAEFEKVGMGVRDLNSDEQMRVILSMLDPTFIDRLGESGLASLAAAYIDPIFEYPPKLKDGALEVLETLSSWGCSLGLISNTGRTPGWAMRIVLENEGLLRYFGALAFSDEEGIRKPDPRIFLDVLESLGVGPGESAHVGDNVQTDVGGAQSAGMKGILIGTREPDDGDPVPEAHIRTLPELLPALQCLSNNPDSPICRLTVPSGSLSVEAHGEDG